MLQCMRIPRHPLTSHYFSYIPLINTHYNMSWYPISFIIFHKTCMSCRWMHLICLVVYQSYSHFNGQYYPIILWFYCYLGYSCIWWLYSHYIPNTPLLLVKSTMTIPCNQRPRQGELGFDVATKADLPTSKFDTLNPKFDRLVLFSFPAVSRGDWLWVKLLWRSKLWDPTKTGPKKQPPVGICQQVIEN